MEMVACNEETLFVCTLSPPCVAAAAAAAAVAAATTAVPSRYLSSQLP